MATDSFKEPLKELETLISEGLGRFWRRLAVVFFLAVLTPAPSCSQPYARSDHAPALVGLHTI